MNESATKVSVIICSVGRPECLAFLVSRINQQSRLPDRLLLVVPSLADAPAPGSLPADLSVVPEIILSPKGLPRQRNSGLDLTEADSDVIVFFDDDFIPSRYALARIVEAFGVFPDVNGMSGQLIADGINGPGIVPEDAGVRVDAWDVSTGSAATGVPPRIRRDCVGLYGCNMAYRAAAICGLRFDERLPLYGWQEDIDFAARIPGRRIGTDAFAGIHCGIKSGRETSGHRLGYSQIVNPIYLLRKGTLPPQMALRLCLRCFAANHAHALNPEPWIDRHARARGNWLGLLDLLRGRADPARILEL